MGIVTASSDASAAAPGATGPVVVGCEEDEKVKAPAGPALTSGTPVEGTATELSPLPAVAHGLVGALATSGSASVLPRSPTRAKLARHPNGELAALAEPTHISETNATTAGNAARTPTRVRQFGRRLGTQ